MKRKSEFDLIIIETTGLADPAPVAQTFFINKQVALRGTPPMGPSVGPC